MPAPNFDQFLRTHPAFARSAQAPSNCENASRSTFTPSGDASVPDVIVGELNPLARKLNVVTDRALDKLDELLTLPTNTEDGNLTRAQTAAAAAVLNAQLRADETRLRARGQVDVLPKIRELIALEKENLKQIEAQ